MKAFRQMIDNNETILELDTRCGKEEAVMFSEIDKLGEGQHTFENTIFIVIKTEGASGMGGMDMGTPDSIIIQRII